MKVVFFQRKPRPLKNFSVEMLFDQVRSYLPSDIEYKIHIAKHYSNGFFNRLFISIDAMFNQSDVNHVTGDIGFITIFLSGKKTILTMLDVGSLNDANPIMKKILQWFWVQWPVYKASYVTTISEASKKELLKYINVKHKKKIRIIYVPVSDQLTYVAKTFNEDCPVILQIGTKQNKNIPRLIEAIKGINCKLEIVGVLNQSQIDILELNNINYRNSVNLSNDELRKKYEEADLVAFVSTYEGFGMPIVEAQIVGRSVITSNLLSMPEVAGEGALLVDPYNIDEIRNGILKIINNEDFRNLLVEKGLKNATRFLVEAISNEYAELYREVFNKNK